MHALSSLRAIRIIFVVVCLSTLLACVSQVFFPVYWSDIEYRPLAPMPAWNDRDQVDAYIREHFGMRDRLVGIFNLLSLLVFQRTNDARIIAGRDGWIFYDGSPQVSDSLPLTVKQLEQWRIYLEGRTRWFQDHHILFRVFIVPDKQSVYPEYFPSSKTRFSRREQLEEYLRTHSFVSILDATDALLEAKSKGGMMYGKFGTHWTSVGAFVGYRFLAENLPDVIPTPLGFDRLLMQERLPAYDLGLLRMLHLLPLGSFYSSEECSLKNRTAKQIVVEPPIVGRPTRPERLWALFSTGNRTLPRALVYRDSFFNVMMPFFSEHFEMVKYVRNGNFDMQREDIDSIRPNLVLQEFVERNLKMQPPVLDEWMLNK